MKVIIMGGVAGDASCAALLRRKFAVDSHRGDMPLVEWDSVNNSILFDVNNPQELEVGSVQGAINMPLPQLYTRQGELPCGREIRKGKCQ